MSKLIQCSVADSLDEFLALEASWSSLLERSHWSSIFQTFAWHRAWLETFLRSEQIQVVLVRDGPALIGIAPMLLVPKQINGVSHRVLCFIGSTNASSDYCDFIIDQDRPEVRDILLKKLQSLPPATVVEFSNLRNDCSLQRTPLTGERVSILHVCSAPAIDFADEEHSRGLLARKSLKRHYNHFAKSGKLEFRHVSSKDEIDSLLPAFFQQHIARRAQTASPSLFHDPQQQRFYHALVRLLPEDILRFSLAAHDGRPIAFHFGFLFHNRFVWYKPAFDPALQQKSPGEVLLKCLFGYCLENQIREFDFTVGDEDFKFRFANTVRSISRIRMYRSLPGYLLERARVYAAKHLKRRNEPAVKAAGE